MNCKFYLILILTGLVASRLPLKAQEKEVFESDLDTEKKPWTHLNFDNDPYDFQFAIVSDRTGSPRAGIFEDAVKKLNWLRPEFVISVGDLIEGAGGKDTVELRKQWNAHFDRIAPLNMPFFHLAGNHDIKENNQTQVDFWNSLFGKQYYYFKYKDVLFLNLFSNETFQTMSEAQITYFRKVVEDNADVRWTFVFLHHPLWTSEHASNFDQIEEMLAGRDYTVFAGHQHTYRHFDSHLANYYILATTGGGSGLLGDSFGQFDHISWVTMSDEGPDIVNIRLDGILPHDVASTESVTLGRQLIQSVFYQSDVFLNNPVNATEGKLLLTYKNRSGYPLEVDARFLHSHLLDVIPNTIQTTVPSHASKTITLDLKAYDPFSAKDKIRLDLDGTVRIVHPDYPDLKLSGTQAVKIRVSDYDVLPSKEVEFVGEHRLVMHESLPGTSIRYTLDGTEPDLGSPEYRTPIAINSMTTVQARLFTEGGMASQVDRMDLKPVQSGKGVICKYYEYDVLAGGLGEVPDFSAMDPVTVKTVQHMDVNKAGPRKEFFGAVFQGQIDLDRSGKYTFSLVSDDGAILLIDGRPAVVDAQKHKPRETFGEVNLKKGKHPFEVHFYQHKKGMVLEVYYQPPGGEKRKVQMSQMSYSGDKGAVRF